MDAQKGVLTLKNPILLEDDEYGKLDNFCFYISLLILSVLSSTSHNLFSLLDITYWIDPCQANSNLLATGGSSKTINVYDKRNSQIVKTFEDIHSGKQIWIPCFGIRIIILHVTHYIESIYCVRWDPSGKRLASSSYDKTVKVLDFASGKVTYSGKTVDKRKLSAIGAFIDLILFNRTCQVYMFPLEKATEKSIMEMMKI